MATIIGLLGNAVVLAAVWGVWVSRNNPKRFLETTGDLKSEKRGWVGPQPWGEKLFHVAIGLGILVFSFGGVHAALSWVPDSWGTVDEDGEWSAYRVAMSSLLTPPLAYWFYETVRQDCIRRFKEAQST